MTRAPSTAGSPSIPRTPRVEVECEGGPAARGAAQGEALADGIRYTLDMLPCLAAIRAARPRWLPYPWFRRLAEGYLDLRWPGRLERDFPEMSAGFEAMATASGVSSRSLRLVNALEPLLATVGKRVRIPAPGGCTALAVRGDASADGQPVIARNFDYLPVTAPTYTFRARSGDLRSLEFTLAPILGAVDGLNEAGLAITYNYAFAMDGPTFTGTISMVVAEALESCRTVQEALDLFAARPRWGGGLLMLADASGDIASLELSSTRCEVRRPAAGEDVIFHTNAYSTPALREVEVPREAVFLPSAPEPLVGKRVLESSEIRFARLGTLFGEKRPRGPEDLRQILADHGESGDPGDGTLCVHSDYWYTTAFIQYFPRERRVHASYSTACEAKGVDLAL